MRAGRIDEADALALRVRKAITRHSSKWLRDINTKKNPRDAWAKVRDVIRGTRRDSGHPPDGISAHVLNEHYAAISTDDDYHAPQPKLTVTDRKSFITEMDMFKLLDTLKPTATGLDGIPAWFLRLGAPIFAAPLCQLFNHSLATGSVPSQWKTAIITPIAKVSHPTKPSDFRPISVTPVLSRSLEKYIVRQYIYPALRQPSTELNFEDQFAFRPTGSTTAAIITLLHTVRSMLTSDDYVHVFSFDLTKAFDTVRHETLMNKMASLELPDNIYNWIKDFFSDRRHCTRYSGQCSTVADIKASVIQGSGLGPASYIITAADLHPVTSDNKIVKFADDMYLIVPASKSSSRFQEIAHIQAWAAANNLKLNCSKSKEIVFTAKGKRGKTVHLPSPCLDIERVNSLRVLGVIINDQLTATDHVSNILASCNSLLYALRILRSHGIPETSLHDVFRATVISKLTYGAPSWSGACSAADRAKLESFISRCKRLGYCSYNQPSYSQLIKDADESFFKRIITYDGHVLQLLLSDRPAIPYSLRERIHNKTLISKTTNLTDHDFLIRMLYKDLY